MTVRPVSDLVEVGVERAGRDLVQQRLPDMGAVTVDEENVDFGTAPIPAPQLRGELEPAGASADDDDLRPGVGHEPRTRRQCCVSVPFAESGRRLIINLCSPRCTTFPRWLTSLKGSTTIPQSGFFVVRIDPTVNSTCRISPSWMGRTKSQLHPRDAPGGNQMLAGVFNPSASARLGARDTSRRISCETSCAAMLKSSTLRRGYSMGPTPVRSPTLKYPHEFGWEIAEIQSVRGSTCMLSSDLMVVGRPSSGSERTACTR